MIVHGLLELMLDFTGTVIPVPTRPRRCCSLQLNLSVWELCSARSKILSISRHARF